MPEQKIVMYDSPEAATHRTNLSGWVSSDGRYWGNNEHMARWSGCTHMTCDCGKVFEKGRVSCDSCQAKTDMERYYALPMVEWDGVTPVCTFDDDRYFFSEDEVLDWMADQDPETSEIRLVLCEPGRLGYVREDNWADDLPEDGELPDGVAAKLAELNEAIKNSPTVCWWPGKQRINIEPLWAELKKQQPECTCYEYLNGHQPGCPMRRIEP
jgi:hypothetical protein